MAVQYAFGKIVTQGLDLNVDAADPTSYPGTGTAWTSVVNRSITGSIVSCSFSSDFKGGIVFDNPSASVEFPGTVANYGTGSFTVEMAFRPTQIEGIHYLVSKNSGSYPNWGVYLSGSGGSGKLFAEYNIDASVSCSVSSSTTFETGSVYQADIVLAPELSGSGLTIDGVAQGTVLANGGGSLTSTSSLFVGSYSTSPTQNFSGSIYLVRAYSSTGFTLPVVNYNTISTRFSKTPIPETAKKVFDILVVAGGGGGGQAFGGGGGAGGLQVISTTTLESGVTPVIVGDGGTSNNIGKNSSFLTYTSYGGGNGGGGTVAILPGNGGSGGGCGISQTVPGSGFSGQGNSGGISSGNNAQSNNNTGGGGGAGEAGRDYNAPSRNGQGGSGSYIASFAAIGGSPAGWFAGGGGGGFTNKLGGIGGGGASLGLFTAGATGSANTGGGGGGGSNGGAAGGKGGSGIVAIRYSGGPIALGGEITQSEGYTYHVFRTVETSSFTIF